MKKKNNKMPHLNLLERSVLRSEKFAALQETPSILGNPVFCDLIHKYPALIPNLSKKSSVQTFIIMLNIYLNGVHGGAVG